MHTTITIALDGHSTKTTRTGSCPGCGRSATRSRWFSATVYAVDRGADGELKTLAEVRAEVEATAAAWKPGPEVFEHDRCRAARTAPPPAGTVTLAAEVQARAAAARAGLAQVLAAAARRGLPLRRIGFDLGPAGDAPRAELGYVSAGELLLWARRLEVTEVLVDASRTEDTTLRVREVRDGVEWCVAASVPRIGAQERLGGAPVTWGPQRRGRRSATGRVELNALAAGLSHLGIPEVVAEPTPGRD